MSEANKVLARLLTEHLTCFGFDPTPELIKAIRGALDQGLSENDFWTCFYSVDMARRRGESFPKSGGIDEEIIRRMKLTWKRKFSDKAKKKQGGV